MSHIIEAFLLQKLTSVLATEVSALMFSFLICAPHMQRAMILFLCYWSICITLLPVRLAYILGRLACFQSFVSRDLSKQLSILVFSPGL